MLKSATEVDDEITDISESNSDKAIGFLRQAIVSEIAPTTSAETQNAVTNARWRLKRVQATVGMVLTTLMVLQRLHEEYVKRLQKKDRNSKRPKHTDTDTDKM